MAVRKTEIVEINIGSSNERGPFTEHMGHQRTMFCYLGKSEGQP